ncbi:MAG: NHLP bacteriocin export ABC transporter permease/ATPase subunit [Marinobacter sp.]
MPLLEELVRNHGRPLPSPLRWWVAGAGEPTVALVESGHVDIFVVPVRDGQPVGRQHHLCRLGPGGLIPGAITTGELGLKAMATPGGTVQGLPRRKLMEGPTDAGSASAWHNAARHWLDALTQRCDLLPEAPLDHAPDSDSWWQAIDQATEQVLQAWQEQLQREADQESGRLSQRRGSDADHLNEALQGMASVTWSSKGTGPTAQPHRPLSAVCNLIGDHLGIGFHTPAGAGPEEADDLDAICRASHVRYRKVALRGWWHHQDAGPLCAFMEDDQRPVALIPSASGGRYQVYDPSRGASYPLTAATAGTLSPFAFSFYRSFGASRLNLAGMMRFGTRGLKREFTLIGTMAALVALLGLITPWATGLLVDHVIPSADLSQLGQLTIALVAVALASAGFGLTQSFSQLRVEGRMDGNMQSAVWDRLLKLPATFFRGYTAGDLASRANGITAIRQELSGTTINSAIGSLFSLMTLGLMFYYSSTLALAALVVVLVAMAISGGCSFVVLRLERDIAGIEGRLSGVLLQLLSGIGKLRASAAEHRAFARWAQGFRDQVSRQVRAEKVRNLVTVMSGAYPLISAIVLFAIMALPESGPELTTGEFLAFNAAFGTFLGAMLGLTETAMGALGIIPLYERATPILHTAPEVDDNQASPGRLQGHVSVQNVSFGYSRDDPPVLSDVSLDIREGEFVAVVGTSGSGKSTLLRLLLGFEQPWQGTVSYDDHDLATLDVGAVRRQLGVVLQNGQLLDGDIFSNIIGSHRLTMADAEEAARLSGLETDIRDMPMGMHTMVSGDGGTLSGGQKQRLLIARAIVHRPRVLFLDEATSALDNHTQQLVGQSLAQLEATRVVIAHRLSTIRNADRIVVMDEGRIAETGSYDELIRRDGLFTRLAQRQVA